MKDCNKHRRLDYSPKNDSTFVRINSNDPSPRTDTSSYRRSVSPKSVYPPSILKFLNSKTSAINKLKTPSKKEFDMSIGNMQLLGMLQLNDIQESILSRKTSSPSSTINSLSPMCLSPTTISPRAAPSNDDIFMMIEDNGASPFVSNAIEVQYQ